MNLKVFPAIAVALAVGLVVAACTGGDSRSRTADISATPVREVSSMSLVPTVVPLATPTSPPPEVLTPSPTEIATPIPTPSETSISRDVSTASRDEAPALQVIRRSLAEIIEALSPSVVHVQTEAVELDQFNRPVPGGGVGTGEIIDEHGHVLTNTMLSRAQSEFW